MVDLLQDKDGMEPQSSLDPQNDVAVSAMTAKVLSCRPQPHQTSGTLPAPVLDLIHFFLAALTTAPLELKVDVARALRFCISKPNECHEAVIQTLSPLLLSTSAPLRMQVANCLLSCYSTAKSPSITSSLPTTLKLITQTLKSLQLASLPLSGSTLRFISTILRTLNIMLSKTSSPSTEVVNESISILGVWSYYNSASAKVITPAVPDRGRVTGGSGGIRSAFGGGVMGSFMPSSSERTRKGNPLSRSSSRSSMASIGSESEDEDPKTSLNQLSAQIRYDALTCLRVLATVRHLPSVAPPPSPANATATQSNSKALYPHWSLFIADSPYVHARCTLLSLVETDASLAVREQACRALVALLDRSSSYLAIAEDRPTKASFTSLSSKIGEIVFQLHLKTTALLLTKHDASNPALASLLPDVLEVAKVIAENSPYGRMQRPIAANLASALLPIVEIPDGKTASLACSTLKALITATSNLSPTSHQKVDTSTIGSRMVALLRESTMAVDVQAQIWTLLGSIVSSTCSIDLQSLLDFLHRDFEDSLINLQESQMYFVSAILQFPSSPSPNSQFALLPYSSTILAVIRSALSSATPQLRALGCGSLASDGFQETNVGASRINEMEVVLDLLNDDEEESLVRAAGCRTLGLLVKRLAFLPEAAVLDHILFALNKGCDEPEPVKGSASWALANACDTLTQENATSLELGPLLHQSLSLARPQNTEKLRTNGLRILGSLLRIASPAQLVDSNLASTEEVISVLSENLSSSMAKVAWNAATAISNALSGSFATSTATSSRLVKELSAALVRSKNYKVRIHCVVGLMVPTEKHAYGDDFGLVNERVRRAKEQVMSDGGTVSAKEANHHNHLVVQIDRCISHLDQF